MKRLHPSQIEGLLARLDSLSADGDTPEWREFHAALVGTKAELYLGLGRLIHPALEAESSVWNSLNMIEILPWETIAGKHAHIVYGGIEGLARIKTDLCDALLVASKLPEFGCAVEADCPAGFLRPVRKAKEIDEEEELPAG